MENVDEWLNETFFGKVIKNHLKLNNKDKEYSFVMIDNKPAVKPGENFMAVLIRSSIVIKKIDGTEESLSYIVKVLIPNDFNETMVTECGVFPKEQKMYSLIIPEFEKLYSDVGAQVTFGPKCYYTTNEPTPIIVMEDLSTYEMIEKNLGLDEFHTQSGLSWMAKFHAASMVYREKFGAFSDEFSSGVFSMKVAPTYQPYLEGYMDFYIDALKSLPHGEKYVEKAEKWRGVLYSAICKNLEYDENSLNVLNHGDMWSNNLMFRYDENRLITDIKLVDYQLNFWGSAASDIYYFMMSSWNIEIKIKKYDELIKFYFNGLVENLKLLKYDRNLPTFEDLKQELSKRKFFGNFIKLQKNN